jgi:hypothetical protein
MLKQHSSYQIFSWEEITNLLNILKNEIEYSTLDWQKGFRPQKEQDLIACALLAEMMNTRVIFNDGVIFSLTDKDKPDVAIFNVENAEDQYELSHKKKALFASYYHEGQKIVYPWKPF